MSNQIIIITKESQDERLDMFLVGQIGKTRSQIQKIIKAGLVTVNGQLPTVHRFLKEGDQVEINHDELEINHDKKEKKASQDNPESKELFKKIKVIDDNDDYMIIEKPAGLLVHPTDQNETNTLIDWAINKYPPIVKIGEDPARAGIVHRLDREVSGLMIIPKTQDAFEYFKRLFKTRQLSKKYLALVYGRVGQDFGEINFRIGRGKSGDGKFAAFPFGSEAGKEAKTLFTVKKRFKNYSLLELEILTGRTHQIRVHLLALGHPIVGDNLYHNNRLKEKLKPGRVFLHAYFLSFKNQQGEEKTYQSELPKSLAELMEKLS